MKLSKGMQFYLSYTVKIAIKMQFYLVFTMKTSIAMQFYLADDFKSSEGMQVYLATWKLVLEKACFFEKNYFTPVLPKPPSPLEVSDSVSTAIHSARSCLAMINWAILSPFSMVKSSEDRLTNITPISPR